MIDSSSCGVICKYHTHLVCVSFKYTLYCEVIVLVAAAGLEETRISATKKMKQNNETIMLCDILVTLKNCLKQRNDIDD